MTDINKAIKPVESLTITPLNEGSQLKANNYIQLKIGASDLNMWLVNNSYLKFDLYAWRKAYKLQTAAVKKSINDKAWLTTDTDTKVNKTYIRNANNIFRSIEILYGGDTIYNQPYNIEQNVIKQLYYGESYMEANYATFTTSKMIKEGIDYLGLSNGEFANFTDASDVVSGVDDANVGKDETAQIIKDIMIPVNQLMPIFSDCTSDGFPVKNLKSQIEIRLYIAEPYRYLVDYDDKINDFTDDLKVKEGAAKAEFNGVTIRDRFGSDRIELKNVKMYCSHYIANQSESAVIDDKINNSGLKLRYQMVHSSLRQMNKINMGNNNLPFTNSTENVKSIMLYCHKQDISPTIMYRPYINSLYIKFGSNQLPFQPIAGDSMSTPHEFKFTSDDVLNNIDTYFSETNDDFNKCYRYTTAPSQSKAASDVTKKTYQNQRTPLSVPESTFVMMGANYVNSPGDLGSNSSRWNSQYQASFMGNIEDDTKLTYVLAITTDYGLILKDGDIKTINL